MKSIVPTMPEIAREAIIVLGGAVLAAAVIALFPDLKAWMKAQWADTPH